MQYQNFVTSIFLLLIIWLGSFEYAIAIDSNYAEKARKALEQITQQQIEKIKNIANTTSSGNEQNIKGYVLSTHIRSFKDIPANIDAEIQSIQERIRLLIRHIATDIEVNGGNSGSLIVTDDGQIHYESNPNLPKALNDKREALLKANLANSVSVRSAALAIQLLANVNTALKSQANKAETRQEKQKAYMSQAIYVYEMADITLDLLNKLKLEGKETLEQLHRDAKKRVMARVNDINTQMNKVDILLRDKLLTSKQAQQEKNTYELMKKANEQSLDAWTNLMNKMGSRQEFLDNLKSKSALIEYKRDKARTQIETLRDLQQVAELHDTIGSLDNLVDAVADLDLLVLDERTVSLLLGYKGNIVSHK